MRTTIQILFAAVWSMALLDAASVQVERKDGSIDILIDGRRVTSLHSGPKWDKPFLYPLVTPAGVALSRGWPVAERPGDSTDHVWHRGLFFGHGDINGIDFWRELGADKTGKLVVNSAPEWRDEALTVVADLMPPKGPRMGSVLGEYRFAREGASYLIEAKMSFRADGGVDLKLGDTEEAAFGVRLAEEFREDRGAVLMNSEGLIGTKNIWGKRAAWVDYSTTREAKKLGLAILDHPSNPRHPTYWHARGYGLNSANSFGVRDFTGDKSKDGSLAVVKGQTVTFRYLVIVHDGDVAEAKVAQRFEAWKLK